MPDPARQCVFPPGLLDRPITVVHDEPATSSDAGAPLLGAVDRTFGVTKGLAASIRDTRQPGKIVHALLDLVRQRVFGIACGYSDCNDSAHLREDPMQRALLGRDPVKGSPLADQSRLSRFENRVRVRDLVRMGYRLADLVIKRHRNRMRRKVVRLVTIDMDPTEDATHGQQQLSFFNGHYESWCYLPILGFLTFNDEAEQHLFAALLRPGVAKATEGAIPLLRRILPRLRKAFPQARIRVRLDGGFAGPEMLDFLEDERLEYVLGLGGNAVLLDEIEPLMEIVRARSEESGTTETLFHETDYAAKSWDGYERRVVMKAEVVRLEGRRPRDNARFVVTNLRHLPENVDRIYRERGHSENRIKELEDDLEMDRTSCTSFLANQLRILLAAAAFVLFQELRLRMSRYCAERLSVGTIRLRLLKVAGRFESSVRRIVIHLAESHVWARDWLRLARSFGAASG